MRNFVRDDAQAVRQRLRALGVRAAQGHRQSHGREERRILSEVATGAAMNRGLIGLGVAIIIAGVLWPWLKRINLFHLPGDLLIKRQGFTLFFPLTTMVIVSVGLSLLAWLIRNR